MYIVLEGIVGSGKTTQVKKLVEYFQKTPFVKGGRGDLFQEQNSSETKSSALSGTSFTKGVLHVREPGSTPIAEDIRYLAQGKTWEDESMHPLTNAYLYAAARAQTLHTVVKPALERGDIVISDRSFLSSCSIQGEAQGVGINKILWINKEAVGDILPDIIFYLDIDVELALSRTFDASGDKFEKEGREFYKKIIRGYEKCAKWKKIRDRWVRIDANGSEEEVFDDISKILCQYFQK